MFKFFLAEGYIRRGRRGLLGIGCTVKFGESPQEEKVPTLRSSSS